MEDQQGNAELLAILRYRNTFLRLMGLSYRKGNEPGS